MNYSNLLTRNGRQTEAKSLLEAYLKNSPTDEKALNNLIIIMADRHLDKKVEANFKRLLRETSVQPSTLYNHGVFLFK